MLSMSLILAAALPGALPPAPKPAESIAAAPAPASARTGNGGSTDIGFETARGLVDKCTSSNAASISYCFAYIAAVHDTMRAYEIWLGEKEFCLPVASSQGDLRRAFVTYLTAYPENGSGQAASVVAVALKQTYVCKGDGPGSDAGTSLRRASPGGR